MTAHRIATYNVEWMGSLFDDTGRLMTDGGRSGRHGVSRRDQAEALRSVFRRIDADAVLVVEAPDAHRRRDGAGALEAFADWAGLRARRALIGFPSQTQQEIALLYDPDRMTARHDPRGAETGKRGAEGAPRFDGTLRIDLDVEGRPDPVRWSKPPLELAVETRDGFAFRMIGVHAKSKAPHGAKGREAMIRVGIENRRKQLAQCIWLRRRADRHLAEAEPLIVLGDLNDGPGLDEFERLFSRSGVEIVLGEGDEIPLYDPHADALARRRFGEMPASARFWIADRGRWMQVLLDYVMVSPDLRSRAQGWRIWHPFDDPDCYADPDLRDALLAASDHFPVTLDIDLGSAPGP